MSHDRVEVKSMVQIRYRFTGFFGSSQQMLNQVKRWFLFKYFLLNFFF